MILVKREHFRTAFHGVDFHRAGGPQSTRCEPANTSLRLHSVHQHLCLGLALPPAE
jgi:hypothetical protein